MSQTKTDKKSVICKKKFKNIANAAYKENVCTAGISESEPKKIIYYFI